MLRKSKGTKFANQAEEASWWKASEGRLADEFEKFAAAGALGPATFVITGDLTLAKIRLGKRDVAQACALAKERGMRCHDYLKMIIHEALEAAKTARKSAAL